MDKRAVLAVAAGLMASGCAAKPEPASTVLTQDITFMRGCWIDRSDARVTKTFRFLPSRDGSPTLEGEVTTYNGATSDDPEQRLQLKIANNGSWLWVKAGAIPILNKGGHYPSGILDRWAPRRPADQPQASWRIYQDDIRQDWFIVKGTTDRIELVLSGTSYDATILYVEFKGERDGCD